MALEPRVRFPGATYHVMGGEDHRCLKLLHWSLLRLKSIRRSWVISGLWLLSSAFLHAQTPTADGLFVVVGGNYPAVRALAVQADGSVWMGGWFTAIGEEQRMNVAHLNADGNLDSHFAAAANEIVDALVVQPDGKILVAGGFTQLGGQTHNGIARLNANGSIDNGFVGDVGGWALALALQPDGKIVVAGSFGTIGGQQRSSLGRLQSNGAVDMGFTANVEGEIYSLALQSDGKILVGGYFNMLAPDGLWRTNLVRVYSDGTLDTNFDPNVNSRVWSLAVQADGRILVGGDFTTVSSQPRSRIARLNLDGSVDGDFNPGVGGSFPYDPNVFSLALQTDGKILVGGFFATVAGQSRYCLARLNSDGSLDTGFNPSANGIVDGLAIQADGKVLAGGEFSYLGGWARYCLGRLNATEPATHNLISDTTTITWLRGGTSPEVSRTSFEHSSDLITWLPLGQGSRSSGGWQLSGVAVPTGGTLRGRGYVSGGFCNASSWLVEAYGGAPVFLSQPANEAVDAGDTLKFRVSVGGTEPLIFQWLKNGVPVAEAGDLSGVATPTLMLTNVLGADAGPYSVVVSNSFGMVTSVVATLTVRDPVISTQPASQSRELGQSVTFSVTANGTAPLAYQWSKDDAPLSGATATSLALTNLQGSDAGIYRVVVSNQWGTVTSAGALLTVNVITLDTNFNVSLSGSVNALIQQPDGKIVLAGDFTTLCGQPRNRIGRVNADGTLDASFNPSVGGPVSALALQTDGKIILGGNFFTVGSQPRTNLARLNPDGALDPAFHPGSDYMGNIYSLAVQSDGKILVGGEFTSMGGMPRNRIARLNGEGTLDTGFTTSADAGVAALAVLADGKILLGGWFHTVNGQSQQFLARVNQNGTLDSGFNPGPDWDVTALTLQADGKILVGGYFTQLGGQMHTNLARLNANGTLDSGFHPQAGTVYESDYPTVNSVAVQADGRILLGGSFSTFNGESRYYLARLYSDGNLDMGFNPTIPYAVMALALRPDGRILLPDTVVTSDGQWHSGLLNLNNSAPATEELTNNNSNVTWLRGGTSPEVWRTTFEQSTDGVIWTQLGEGTRTAGGWRLTNVSNSSSGTLRARGHVTGGLYNGSCWFVESSIGSPFFLDSPASRTNNAGTTAGFDVVVGGSKPFSFQWLKDDVPIADAVNVHGATTTTLQISNVLKADEGLYSVIVTNAFGSAKSAVARLTVIDPVITAQPSNQFGQLAESAVFNVGAVGTPPLAYQWLKDELPLSGATQAWLTLTNLQASDAGSYRVIISNQFGSATSTVALLTMNLATLDFAFPTTFDGEVSAVAVQPDGKVLVGGSFTKVNGQSRTNLARLNGDGTLDTAFNPRPNAPINALAIQPDGKILVGGSFTALAGLSRNSLGRLNTNGSFDNSFSVAMTSGATVNALALQADNKILVGGAFDSVGGQARTNLARLLSNGTLESGFNPAPRTSSPFPRFSLAEVKCLAEQPDGKIVLGGAFATLAGQAHSNLGRLNADGTIDSGFSTTANSNVFSLVLQNDDKILVGGSFTRLAGQPSTNLARLNPDGSLDGSFHSTVTWTSSLLRAPVASLAIQTDGTILVGGNFTSVGGQARTNLARLDTTGAVDNLFNPGPAGTGSSAVKALTAQADGKLLVGGSFLTISGQPHTNFARLNRVMPATQSLSFDGSTITWWRQGASPEVWRTTFEASTNGVTWVPLAGGQRVLGGWQLTNLTLRAGAAIRARGFVAGSGIGESIVETTLSGVPVIVTRDGGFGVVSNQFGFSVDGLPGWTVVIERSSDLYQWFPLQTNVLGTGPLYIGDPDWWQNPQQFYRVRLAP